MLPTIIDAGLGANVGFQNIHPDTRRRLGEYVSSVMISLRGGMPVILQWGREQLLPRDKPR